MRVNVTMQDPKALFVAPVNELTEKWGVYAIPWMYRHPSGDLVVRANGHQDTLSPDYVQAVPDRFYRSSDGGDTWREVPASPEVDFTFCFEHLFARRQDGKWIRLRMAEKLEPLNGLPCREDHPKSLNRETLHNIYRYGDIPQACRQLYLETWDGTGTLLKTEKAELDFPDLNVYAVSAGILTDGQAILEPTYVPVPEILYPTYDSISGILALPDGSLGGMIVGPDPEIRDRLYVDAYFVASEDGGITWKKRALIGGFDPITTDGYAYENSCCVAPDGSLVVVMRTESCVPQAAEPFTGLMISRSGDCGHTWSKPVPLTDSSVTPHLIALKNGLLVLVYGRPGVHMRWSSDSGKTWSDPVTVIGKTLDRHRALGDDYMDCKYWKMETYANTYMEAVSDDTVLLCYNDMKYDAGDGLAHRATLVRKITFRRED